MVFKNLPGVYVTILEPTTSESAITDIWCSQEHTGRIELEDQPIRILHLWTFDFGGRKFAYGLSYGINAIENGKRIPVGAASAVIFYDVDGSGRFTVLKGANYPFMPDLIPEWAKTGTGVPSK